MDKEKFANDETEPEGKQNPNRSSSRGYKAHICSMIEQSQLEHSVNVVDVAKESTENSGMDEPRYGKLTDVSTGIPKGESEFEKYPETQHYCKEHDVPESAKVQGSHDYHAEKTPTFGKTDDTASGNHTVEKAE